MRNGYGPVDFGNGLSKMLTIKTARMGNTEFQYVTSSILTPKKQTSYLVQKTGERWQAIRALDFNEVCYINPFIMRGRS